MPGRIITVRSGKWPISIMPRSVIFQIVNTSRILWKTPYISAGKDGWMPVKPSTDMQKKNDFWKKVLIYFLILLAIYLYFVLADLSTAPRFVYSQF